ncbi:MAG: hypothetical protein GWO24_10320 [Akkermansiaceae bacterium]|nr:hypothetical protein [Akkermansiaceae bacterium]
MKYLAEAKKAGAWAEIEKPFWWDTPLWLSTGHVQSVGIAHNHMQRGGVLGTEAWGRPRDLERYPGAHGNGLYTQDLYYRILNCGLRIPPSAGSASGVLPNPVGYNRVYVQCGATLDWDRWWDGLAKGRSFVTNGPLLRLTANGALPGEVMKSDGALKVVVTGRLSSNDAIRKIELVRNGTVSEVKLPLEFRADRSGWFLVRAIAEVKETFRFASTAPWYVEIGGAPMKVDRESALFFLEWARERKVRVEAALPDPAQRAEVAAAHQAAVAYWQEMVATAAAVGR